jgi:hypothetical protein
MAMLHDKIPRRHYAKWYERDKSLRIEKVCES